MTKVIDKSGDERDPYFELVRQFPLRLIRNDNELERATKFLFGLVDRELTPVEEQYRDVLENLIETNEHEHHPIPSASDAEVLTHLMEAKSVNRAELSEGTGIVDSTISNILTGKR